MKFQLDKLPVSLFSSVMGLMGVVLLSLLVEKNFSLWKCYNGNDYGFTLSSVVWLWNCHSSKPSCLGNFYYNFI